MGPSSRAVLGFLALLSGCATALNISLLAAQVPPAALPRGPAELPIFASAPNPSKAEVLRAALKDGRAEMRLTAARIIGVNNATPLVRDVAQQLEIEQDAHAATEELRALLLIGSAEALAAAERSTERAPEPALTVYASWLARTAPERLLARPAIVRAVDVSRVLDAGQRSPELRAAALRAWLAAGDQRWTAALPKVLDANVSGDVPLIVEALDSTSALVRERTVWIIAGRMAAARSVPAPVIDAVVAGAVTQGSVTWERIGRPQRRSVGVPIERRADKVRVRRCAEGDWADISANISTESVPSGCRRRTPTGRADDAHGARAVPGVSNRAPLRDEL